MHDPPPWKLLLFLPLSDFIPVLDLPDRWHWKTASQFANLSGEISRGCASEEGKKLCPPSLFPETGFSSYHVQAWICHMLHPLLMPGTPEMNEMNAWPTWIKRRDRESRGSERPASGLSWHWRKTYASIASRAFGVWCEFQYSPWLSAVWYPPGILLQSYPASYLCGECHDFGQKMTLSGESLEAADRCWAAQP